MIYFAFFYLLLFFSILSWNSPKVGKSSYAVLIFLFWILICLRRMDVGIDTEVYHGFFSGLGGYYGTIDNPTERLEPGLTIIGKLLRILYLGSSNSYLYMIVLCTFTIMVLHRGLSKYATNPVFSLFLILTVVRGAFMVVYIAALRQCLSMSLLLLGAFFLVEKKDHHLRNFIIMAVLSFFIHRTSLITAFALFFLDRFELTKKVAYIIIGIVAISSVFVSALFSDVLFSVLMFMDSNMGFDKYSYYMESDSFENASRGFLSAGVNIVIPIICVYATPNNRINNLFLKSLILGTSIFLLFGSFEQGSRMVAPFMILGFIGAIPYTLSLKKKYHLKKNIKKYPLTKIKKDNFDKAAQYKLTISKSIRSSLIVVTIVLGLFLISRAYIAYFVEETMDILPYHFLWE